MLLLNYTKGDVYMGTVKYNLNPPSQNTLARMKEVQMYMFMQSFLYKYNHENQYILNLIESLALLYDCKPHMITAIISHFKSPAYKPEKEEIVVTSFYLGIPVRGVINITGIGNDTYYRKLNSYIARNQPELVPRFSNKFYKEIDQFIDNAVIMFKDISNALKGTEIYDEYQIRE